MELRHGTEIHGIDPEPLPLPEHDPWLCGIIDPHGDVFACPACRAGLPQEPEPIGGGDGSWMNNKLRELEWRAKEREECLPEINEQSLGNVSIMHVGFAINEVIHRLTGGEECPSASLTPSKSESTTPSDGAT